MNLRIYQYILAVAELEHFGKAAQRCHVSQPTLSQQIKKYEDYAGITLFERDNKNVRLTRIGQTLVPLIKNILDADKRLTDTIQHLKKPEDGKLILGAFPTLAPFYIPSIMPAINKNLPNLKIYWVEERSPDLIAQLKNGNIDAAFLALPLESDDGLVVRPLFEEPLLAAVPKSSAFSTRKNLSLKDLKSEPLLLLEDSHCLSGQALEACEWAGHTNRHDFRATSIETLRHMVGSGLGITLVPQMAVPPSSDSVSYVALKDRSARRTIGIVYRKTSPLISLLDKIIAIIKDTSTVKKT